MATGGTIGISGAGVALAVGGALLVYAALSDKTPLEALREVASGRITGVPNKTAQLTPPRSGGGGSAETSGPHPEFVEAARDFRGDRYSQTLRNRDGYSDCSSFCAKAMRKAGVKGTHPGGWPRTTITFKSWSEMGVVSRSAAGAGDLAITDADGSTAHMVMMINNDQAIGQQNSRTHVKTGPVDQLMGGKPYKVYRWTGIILGREPTGPTITERPYTQRLT